MVEADSNVSQAGIKFLWSPGGPQTSGSPDVLVLVLRSQACAARPRFYAAWGIEPRAKQTFYQLHYAPRPQTPVLRLSDCHLEIPKS